MEQKPKQKRKKLRYNFDNPTIPTSPYRPMKCGAANHAMANIPHSISRYEKDKLANILTYSHGKLTVKIEGIDKPIPESVWRMLDYFMLEFTRQNKDGKSTSVEIQFDDFAEYRNATDPKARLRLRQQMQENLDILYRVSIDWSNPDKKDFLKSRIIYQAGYLESKKTLKVSFIPDFAKHISGGYLMPFDTRLGALENRNPNLYKIARKLIYHYSMLPNKERKIHDRISFKKLLECVPDIPTPEEVSDKYHRSYYQFIVLPIENCLNKLVDIGIISEWTWWKKANISLSQQELDNMDWNLIKNCMIHFEVCTPPHALPV